MPDLAHLAHPSADPLALRPPGPQPLLTIAIPTFNRSAELASLLASLVPQLLAHPEVELLISDNASADDTPDVIRRFQDIAQLAGLPITSLRHPENLGSDRNFVFCFEQARGHFFWLCGDDDLILPGALDLILPHLATLDLDILYATSFGFRDDPVLERTEDPLGRRIHTFTDPRQLARVVNIMFTFISSIIVNRTRLLHLPRELHREAPSDFIGTNLTQLSWALPLLRHHRRSAVLWRRTVAGRQGSNGGYSLAHVFGERLTEVLARLLPDRPDLVHEILAVSLRRWFPSTIVEIRSSGNQNFALGEAGPVLRRTFRRDPRFWIFTWPVLALPLPLARLWLRLGAAVNKLIYVLTVPRFWRKET